FIVFSHGAGLAGWVLAIPVWPVSWQGRILEALRGHSAKAWFFFQTQILALSFAAGNLLAFFIMLLATDINFVWRSTLLEASDILPLLDFIAWPWQFWQPGQPGLELLRQTQDFRLQADSLDAGITGLWWRYVLAAQLCYNLLPRTLMLLYARYHYRRHSRLEKPPSRPVGPEPVNKIPQTGNLAEVQYRITGPWSLVNWADAPEFCLEYISEGLGQPQRVYAVTSLDDSSLAQAVQGQSRPVVLVKSWEPPLGELRDYLGKGPGYILPLDWTETEVGRIKPVHLQEWQRFCGSLSNWKLLQVAP
ncbi:MAG: DUF2868 domain-containing protein, partial [Pseudohongiellaceae bacterium]